jgi:hypothetical protein
MIWVSWRLQCTEVLIAAAIFALLAALLVPTGIEMASTYHRDGLSACLSQDTSGGCAQAIDAFTSRFDGLRSLIAWFTIIPGLIGVLLAAPFVLELENGAYRLAWTQSITRRRWIVSKLGLAIAAALLAALALTLLETWWHTPFVHLEGRMDSSVFDSEGTVIFGYTLFALGLATAVGAVWRRAVPALVVAFVGYFAARVFVDTWLRQHLVTPLSATWQVLVPDHGGVRKVGGEPASLNHAWIISQNPSDKLGHPVSVLVGVCSKAQVISGNCLAQKGGGYMHAVYEPASRFWLLQGVETALFGGIALVLIGFAAWWTHERTA